MIAFLIAEHDNKTLMEASIRTVHCARQLSESVTLLVIGAQCQTVAEQGAKIEGVDRVIVVDAPEYQYPIAENFAEIIVKLASKADYLLAAATTFGKNLLPRVAALLDVGQISDITAVISPDTFVRPIYAGNALATVQSLDPVKVITVRSSVFPVARSKTELAPIEKVEVAVASPSSQFIKLEQTPRERPELTTARVVVAGGRGLQSAENFKLLEALADHLGAALGASRAAVDAGFVPNDYQVGQTGKVVAPDLYIAIGISGAIQHIAGMKDSKVIVAINKDPDAPIFNVADYGIVGDLFDLVPQLTSALKAVSHK